MLIGGGEGGGVSLHKPNGLARNNQGSEPGFCRMKK